MHYDRAQELYAQGKLIRAREHVKLSLLHEKNSLDALRLKQNIDADLKGEVAQFMPFMDAKEPYPEPPLDLPLPISTDESRSKTLGTMTGGMQGTVGTAPPAADGGGSPELPQAGSQPAAPGGTGNSNSSTTTTNGQFIPPPPSP